METNDYYDVGGIPAIDYICAKLTEEEYTGFLRGNVIKYISRAGYKGDALLSDLIKAREYLDWLIEAVETQRG